MEPDGDDDDGVETGAYYAGKTEAERRFEERKRKRVGVLSFWVVYLWDCGLTIG